MEKEGAAPCSAQVSSPGAEFGNLAAELPGRTSGRASRDRSRGDMAEPGGIGSAQDGQTRQAASMFSRNHRSRVTVARGSALEMEFKRGRFRLSLFSDPPEVRAPRPSFPLPTRLPQPRPRRPRPCARRGAETSRVVSKPVVVDFKSQARTDSLHVNRTCAAPDTPWPRWNDLPLPGQTSVGFNLRGPRPHSQIVSGAFWASPGKGRWADRPQRLRPLAWAPSPRPGLQPHLAT